MNKWFASLLFIAAAIAGPGCGVAPYSLSHHTLTLGQGQEHDVLWVVRGGSLIMRCWTDPQGPVCIPARGQ